MLIVHERSGPRSVSDCEYEYYQTKFKRLTGKIKTKHLPTLAVILASDLRTELNVVVQTPTHFQHYLLSSSGAAGVSS